MAAATLVRVTPDTTQPQRRNVFASYSAVANALDNSGVQDVFMIDVEGLAYIAVELNVGVNALAALQLKASFIAEDATPVTLRSVAGDFTTPKGVLLDASGDLTVLAVGQGWFIMRTSGMSKLIISANSSAAGGSTLAISAGGATI